MKDRTLQHRRDVVLALSAVLASFGGLYWLLAALDLLPPWRAGLGSYLFPTPYHLAPYLLFWPSTSLALALKTRFRLLLAIPYIVLSCLGFYWVALVALLKLMHDGFWVTGGLPIILFISLIVVVPMYLTHLVTRLDATRLSKVYIIGLALQVLVSVGVGYFFSAHYGTWQHGEPLRVERLRLSDGPLTLPLIEERQAFLVDRQGNMHRIDLTTGRAQVIAEIPRPTDADGAWLRQERPYSEERQLNHFVKGSITRVAPDELSFRYVYVLYGRITVIDARVNQTSGEVTWQPKDHYDYALPHSHTTVADQQHLHVSQYTGDWAIRRVILVEGERTRTLIDPLSRVDWMHAEHGWILIGTSRGGLIIATIKEN
jgi:FtsH-binding integral membrane protein